MTYLLRAFLFAFALQTLSVSVQAGESIRELAGQFIDLSRLDERRAQTIELMTAAFREASKNDPNFQARDISEAERTELFGVMQAEIEVIVQELAGPLRENMITFYVERFTEDELRELIAIYQAPVFTKQFDVMPELRAQNSAMALDYMRDAQQRIVDRVKAWVKEKEAR